MLKLIITYQLTNNSLVKNEFRDTDWIKYVYHGFARNNLVIGLRSVKKQLQTTVKYLPKRWS